MVPDRPARWVDWELEALTRHVTARHADESPEPMTSRHVELARNGDGRARTATQSVDTSPGPGLSSEARWLDRHLTMYGQELTDGGRRANASHRRQIPPGPGRVPGRPRR
jgi:hypothetical protein